MKTTLEVRPQIISALNGGEEFIGMVKFTSLDGEYSAYVYARDGLLDLICDYGPDRYRVIDNTVTTPLFNEMRVIEDLAKICDSSRVVNILNQTRECFSSSVCANIRFSPTLGFLERVVIYRHDGDLFVAAKPERRILLPLALQPSMVGDDFDCEYLKLTGEQ